MQHFPKLIVIVTMLTGVLGCSRRDDSRESAPPSTGQAVYIGLTEIKPYTIEQYFSDARMPPPPITAHYHGLIVSDPFYFFNIYLEYDADIKEILGSVSSLHAEPSNDVDSYPCRPTAHRPTKSDFERNALGTRVDWYFSALSNPGLTVYECMRFPDDHLIAFDKTTGRVVHHVANIRD